MGAPRFVLDRFWPSNLFLGGIPGAWYDPTDLSTMFQDSTGTTPVTAVEQPVGLILDKSGNANHATQATAASRPTYRARYNLLTYSEDFGNAAWTKNQTTVTTNAAVAPDGTTTADTVIPTVAGGAHSIYTSYTYAAGVHTLSMYAKANGYNWIKVASSLTGNGVFFDVLNGAVGTANAGYTGTIQAVGSGWFRCVTTWTAAAGFDLPGAYIATANGALSFNGDGTSGVLLWGAQLLTAADVTATGNAYQRIAAATVYDTAPIFRPYLAFDGMDDSLSTAAIDFTATDKMTVFAGETKLQDAALSVLAELSTDAPGTNGTFWLLAPYTATERYSALSRGTSFTLASSSSAVDVSPNTSVLTARLDIAAPLTQLIVNRAVRATNTASQGTGNYGNWPLFIGRRNNASFPFNGRLYSLIVRGAASSTTEIIDTETWVNARTGGY